MTTKTPPLVDYVNSKGDVKRAAPQLETFMAKRGYTPTTSPSDAGELKGKALDEALTAVDLPTHGTADEKRQRLAEHAAGTPDPSQDS